MLATLRLQVDGELPGEARRHYTRAVERLEEAAGGGTGSSTPRGRRGPFLTSDRTSPVIRSSLMVVMVMSSFRSMSR